MEARNCPRCGRVFYYIKSPVCPECEKKEEEAFNVVREYLNENPKHTIAEITRDTKVSTKLINKFLREGRLEITEGLNGFLLCMNCNKPIMTGKYCNDCASKFSKKLESAYTKKSPDSSDKGGPKMHYFKRP